MKAPLDAFKSKLLDQKEKAESEAYAYFNANIRPLDPDGDGLFNPHNDDSDAFRHAYVSGVFAMEYGSTVAKKLGDQHEKEHPNPEKEKAMDLWNNKIGRKYGEKAKSRKQLAEMLKKALKNGELIVNLADLSKLIESEKHDIDPEKSIIVLQEDENGRNKIFFDLITGLIMDADTFIDKIASGEYPGYEIADINGQTTPKSKADFTTANNLE